MSTQAHTPQTRNITRLFRNASAEQVDTGLNWYADAHSFAAGLAGEYGVTVSQASGIISALSPLQGWGANKRLAERFIAENGLTSGYLSAGLNKAQAILDGTDVLDVLRANKTRNFFMAILTAGEQGVTIDRHSYSLTVNHRFPGGDIPKLSDKVYSHIAELHRRAAEILSAEQGIKITAAQTQAVTWTAWRHNFWSVGAFDA